MEDEVKLQLYKSRLKIRQEMRQALVTISPAGKRKLAARWREEYSELFYKELLRCAKSVDCRETVANWKLDEL
jgi:hypothetical protein